MGTSRHEMERETQEMEMETQVVSSRRPGLENKAYGPFKHPLFLPSALLAAGEDVGAQAEGAVVGQRHHLVISGPGDDGHDLMRHRV